MRRAKRAEGRAGEVTLALHMIENKVVVADPGDVPQRARTQADEARSPDHFFAAGIGINAIDDQRQPVACSRAAPEARQQFREIVLVEQAQGRIVHLANHQAVLLAFGLFLLPALLQEFLAQIVGRNRFGRRKDQIAHGGLGVAQKRGAPVAVRLLEIRTGTARHELALKNPVFDQGDFLAAHALFIHGVSADEPAALELFCSRVVHERHARRQNPCTNAPDPVALPSQSGQHLFEHRAEGYGWPRSVDRRAQHLCQQRCRRACFKQHRPGVILRRGRRAQGH